MEFPEIKNNQDLADFLEIKKEVLAYYAYYGQKIKIYNSFQIRKRSGDFRLIESPVKGLKEIQKQVLKKLEPQVSFRPCVYGFIKNRGIAQNAEIHVRQNWLLRLDIKDFFPTITTTRLIGLFKSKQFSMAPSPARALALICTKDGRLPQGAPSSPILTNILCKGLDYKLQRLAQKHKCYYSRYADDIFISTDKKFFPAELASYDEESASLTVGHDIISIINSAGFTINEDKSSLKHRSQRQVTTGLVVNQKVNVSKEYVRSVRAALYSWQKFGLEAAEKHWQSNVCKGNRHGQASARFRWVVRGQVSYIGSIKGKSDPVYLSLAKKLNSLDSSFIFDEKFTSLIKTEEIHIYTEGKTDKKHIESAIRSAGLSSNFSDLNIVLKDAKKDGSGNLKSLCHNLSTTSQKFLTICIFDRDEPEIIKEMGGSSGDYLDHNNNVYSLIIPNPEFRKNTEICIEHLYKDNDLFKIDANGRRLYARSEFDEHNCHKTESNIFIKHPPKSLICDSGIINILEKKNIALTKNDFAEAISAQQPPFQAMDFDGFIPLFEKIREIKNIFQK